MKTLRGLWLICMIAMSTMCALAQRISVKEVTQSTSTIVARTNNVLDAKQKSCAYIRVLLPSASGLSFNEAVKAENITGGYGLFVSPDIKQLNISDESGNKLLTVRFADYGIAIKEKTDYEVILEKSRDKAVVFQLTPANASLTINGEAVVVNHDGTATIFCKPGSKNTYKVESVGYNASQGSFNVDDDNADAEPMVIELERKLVTVRLNTNAKKVEVLNNGESLGTYSNGENFQVEYGTKELTFTADKYVDAVYTEEITDYTNVVSITMEKARTNSQRMKDKANLYIFGGAVSSYDNVGEDNKKLSGGLFGFGINYEHPFNVWFSTSIGFEYGWYAGKDMKQPTMTNEEVLPSVMQLPIVFYTNVPLGRYNRNFFSIGVGVIPGYTFFTSDKKLDDEESGYFSYGARVTARLILRKFVFGVGVDYMRYGKNEFIRNGAFIPQASLGIRF